jgi:CorA-like Mg2+ transporter protein
VITTCAVRADPPDPHDEEAPGRLIVSPVELMAGEKWLLSCWHAQRIYAGPREPVDFAEPDDAASTIAAVGRRWRADERSTAGDLGVQVMMHLALSYAKAHRTLYGWLELWELNLYEQDVQDPAIVEGARAHLRRMWGLRAALRDWLSPLNVPGLGMDLSEAWLPATDHQAVIAVDDRIDKALGALAKLGETLRASFQLLHLQEHQIERERAERRLRQLELIAAIFLIPTLVVGLYGSNTWLPGQGEVWGFLVMLAGLFVLTTIGLVLIRRVHEGRLAAARREQEARTLSRTATAPTSDDGGSA